MGRLGVLLAFVVFIGVVSSFPERSFRIRRSLDQFKSKKANLLELSKKNVDKVNELNELQALVNLLKRQGGGQQDPKAGSEQGHSAGSGSDKKGDKKPKEQEGKKSEEDYELVCDKSEERTGLYLWHVMETVGENAPAKDYYQVIIEQMEVAVRYLMQVINDCNEAAGGHAVYDVEAEFAEIQAQANAAYVNAGWDTIEQEFKELEKIFEEKKAKVAGMAESWSPFCWVSTDTLHKEVGYMHGVIGFMKLYQYMLEVHQVDILAGH